MGTARYARPGDRLRPSLERPHGDRAPEVHSWAGSGPQQVLRQRTQQLDSARLLAGGLGEARHPGLSRALSAGRLSPAGKSSNWSIRATGTRKWGRSSSSANRPSKTTSITFSTSSGFLTASSWPSTSSTTDWLSRGSIIAVAAQLLLCAPCEHNLQAPLFSGTWSWSARTRPDRAQRLYTSTGIHHTERGCTTGSRTASPVGTS